MTTYLDSTRTRARVRIAWLAAVALCACADADPESDSGAFEGWDSYPPEEPEPDHEPDNGVGDTGHEPMDPDPSDPDIAACVPFEPGESTERLLWLREYDSGMSSKIALAVDEQGSAVVAGIHSQGWSQTSLIAMSHAPDGPREWVWVDPLTAEDTVSTSVTAAPGGGVLLGGRRGGTGSVVHLDSEGHEAWGAPIVEEEGSCVSGVAVDEEGRSFLTRADSTMALYRRDMDPLASPEVLWWTTNADYRGLPSVAATGAGPRVAGEVRPTSHSRVLASNLDGTPAWSLDLDEGRGHEAHLEAGPADSVFVAFTTEVMTGPDERSRAGMLLKLGADGQEQWRHVTDHCAESAYFYAAAMPDGGVAALYGVWTGFSPTRGDTEYQVHRFDAEGGLLWTEDLPLQLERWVALGLESNAAGDLYFAAYYLVDEYEDPNLPDYVVAKIDGD